MNPSHPTIIEYAGQGNAVLGIRDSGKTYTATYMAEQCLKAGISFVAFDPIGVWRYLKVPGKGKGFPVVVAGGEAPDLPLNPKTAPEIVRAAMRSNVPLVIDLFDINLSKADWRRIVEESIRVLLYENKASGQQRHIFIEEAPEFVPQQVRPECGSVYAEIEKLARMGGNAYLGYTLISQRAEQVNKAVLELCDCILLHRQKGKNSLTSLGKWLDFASKEKSAEIIKTLPTLGQGQAWIWKAGSDAPELTKVPAKQSLHPDRRNPEAATRKGEDVSQFIRKLTEVLPKLAEEKDANDPVKLRKRIKELEAQIAKIPAAIDPREREQLIAQGVETGKRAALRLVRQRVGLFLSAAESDLAPGDTQAKPPHVPMGKRIEFEPQPIKKPARSAVEKPDFTMGSPLPVGERAILIAAAQHEPTGVTREQLTVMTGYKRSSRDAYIARLKAKELISDHGSVLHATFNGKIALGDDYEPLPKGEELKAYWLERLPAGEAKVLGCVLAWHPDPTSREIISAETGYLRSSRDAYLSRLAARQLVKFPAKGLVTASSTLFDE